MIRYLLFFALILPTSLGSAQSANREELQEGIAHWRVKIDAVDQEIVVLLNKRTEYVLQLSPLKKKLGATIQDKRREAIVLENLRKANTGALPGESLEKVYQAIMEAMRDLQARR